MAGGERGQAEIKLTADSGECSCGRETSKGLVVRVHVVPGAKRSECCGVHGDAIKLKVRARAVEGAANEAVRELMSELMDVPIRQVIVQRGATSRRKEILIEGLSLSALSRLL